MDLIDYLNETINSYIFSSISRVIDSGYMGYHFSLNVSDIRDATGRSRIHEGVVVSHFSKAKIDCQYDQTGRQYLIHLDLNTARLNPHQSKQLGDAINKFRLDHL